MSLITYNGESKVIKRICELLDTMTGINFVVVQTLPTTDISTSTIYLVPKQSAGTDNIYDEYINTDGTSQGWELIGTTEIDLSNYYTKTETDDLLDDKADIGDIPTDFVPKSTGGVFDGNVEIVTANSGTSNVNSRFRLGNNKAVGTVGNTRGVIQIFDQNGNYTNIFASDNASSGNVYLPKDKENNSVLAIENDVDKAETGNWNLVHEPFYDHNRTANQLTFTVNQDGSVTVNGTASASTNYRFKATASNWTLPKGRYRLTGCPSGGSDSTYKLRANRLVSGSSVTYGDDYGSGIEFEVTDDTANTAIYYILASGSSYTDFVLPIPKLVSIEKVDWVSNGILGAKNLNAYPPYNETSHTDTGVVFTDNGDGTIKATGKSTSASRSGFVCHSRSVGSVGSFFLKNGTYILTGCPSGGSETSYYIEVGRTVGSSLSRYGRETGDGLVFTVDGDANNTDKAQIQLVCYCYSNYQLPNDGIVFKPMIRLVEDTDNEWQPYTMTNKQLTDMANSVPTSAGTYTLQATRNSDGTITYSWV